MKNIAITGSYSSGKSFVLKCAHSLGYKTFSCDVYIRQLYKDINLQKIVEDAIDGLGKFDKKKLAEIIYNNPSARKKLEELIHPMVRLGIKEFEEENQTEEIIFTEVPLLFETGFDKYFSYSIAVFCSESIRITRAKSRGIANFKIFEKIKNTQLSQDEKRARADFSINSEGSFSKVKASLIKIIDKIK